MAKMIIATNLYFLTTHQRYTIFLLKINANNYSKLRIFFYLRHIFLLTGKLNLIKFLKVNFKKTYENLIY